MQILSKVQKPIFGEILVDGYLSGMGLSEKINHTLSTFYYRRGEDITLFHKPYRKNINQRPERLL